MRKLSQLLEHTALSGDTMRKAEHKILQLRSELQSAVMKPIQRLFTEGLEFI